MIIFTSNVLISPCHQFCPSSFKPRPTSLDSPLSSYFHRDYPCFFIHLGHNHQIGQIPPPSLVELCALSTSTSCYNAQQCCKTNNLFFFWRRTFACTFPLHLYLIYQTMHTYLWEKLSQVFQTMLKINEQCTKTHTVFNRWHHLEVHFSFNTSSKHQLQWL
jgi:hypothetical protein